MVDFLKELREHWNDQYWWLDHQALRVALLAAMSGAIGLLFVYLQVKVEQAARGTQTGAGDAI